MTPRRTVIISGAFHHPLCYVGGEASKKVINFFEHTIDGPGTFPRFEPVARFRPRELFAAAHR
jgi:hypothetical protein